MGAIKGGEMVYMIYRAVTYGLSPLINLQLRRRNFRGLQHPLRWPERLGRLSWNPSRYATDPYAHVATTFGLSLVKLDIRQESDRHTDVLDAIT
ncbi:unnamed protein product [Lactuca virosa]|uniref:Uncharacterized protein n=1 Tax=Lactuca virosa TaxID=75947 RepID=A0AAU9PKD4_9ASTR|nr:unnamed protein product [Lactuca virosa]